MKSLEMELLLVKGEVRKLKELEKQNDYFTVKDIGHWCYTTSRDLYTVKVEILDPLYENSVKLLVKLKEFGDKDSLTLDG